MDFNLEKFASMNLPDERRESNTSNLSNFRKNSLFTNEEFSIKTDIDLSKHSPNIEVSENSGKQIDKDSEFETRERKNCSIKSNISNNSKSTFVYKLLFNSIKYISSKIDLNLNNNSNLNQNNNSESNQELLNEFILMIYGLILSMTSPINIVIFTFCFICYFFLFDNILNSFCLLMILYEGYKAQYEKRKDYTKLILLFLIINYILDIMETVLSSVLIYVPYYYLLKLIVVMWMLYPSLRGLNYLYSLFLYKILNNTNETESITYKFEEYFKIYDKKYSSIVGS